MECRKTRDLCALFKRCNARVFCIVGSAMQEPGLPDRYICHKYFKGWVEFKDEKTRVNPKQRTVIHELRERGGMACVCRFMSDEIWVEDHKGFRLGCLDNPTTPREAALFLQELSICCFRTGENV